MWCEICFKKSKTAKERLKINRLIQSICKMELTIVKPNDTSTCCCSLVVMSHSATLWTVACGISQARILEWVAAPEPGIQPSSPASPALAGGFFT